jgi:anti-sigma regulatory factor (Ser/Thr protein kinase)
VTPTPDDLAYRLLLTADVRTVRIPRKLVEIALDNRDLGHLKDKASLIVSELVTNTAQVVPGTEIEVGVCLRDGWVRLEVSDRSPEIPNVPASLSLTDEGGRGLFVADALADKFGIDPRPPDAGGGKTIWAALLCDSDEITDDAAA